MSNHVTRTVMFRACLGIFICLWALVFLWPISAVGAQDEGILSFDNVHLWVYPEFDDPRLLVMLQGQISGAQPPVTVSFLVPSTAEMYSAGSIDSQSQYSGGPPDREPSAFSGWDAVSYELTSDIFHV